MKAYSIRFLTRALPTENSLEGCLNETADNNTAGIMTDLLCASWVLNDPPELSHWILTRPFGGTPILRVLFYRQEN